MKIIDNMEPKSPVVLILGLFFIILGVIAMVKGWALGFGGIVPLLVGSSLCYLGWSNNRVALLVFGHTCIVLGCFLITWGIYLLPHSKPILSHIFGRPLFWGLFSLMGGICAIYHGFCQCVRRQNK